MTRSRTPALLLAAALALVAALAASSAPAAASPGVPQSAPGLQKIVKSKFTVMNMLYQSIQVRGLADLREIHTFTYAPEIRDKMQEIFNAGGFHYGDKVEVWYRPGDNVAVKIKGKPSKPK
jgi:hypothetical protein